TALRKPDSPWLLAHALLAFGPHAKLNAQITVRQYLLQRYIQRKGNALFFPKVRKKNVIEPHPFFFLFLFSQLQQPLSSSFTYQNKQYTLQELFTYAKDSLPPNLKGKRIGRNAWRYLLLRRYLRPNEWFWRTPKGQQVRLFQHVWNLLLYLDRQTMIFRQLQRQNRKEIPKHKIKGQYLYGEIYGGFYLLRAALAWMAHPILQKTPKIQRLVQAQLDILFYRYHAETALYQRLFRSAKKNPGRRLLILIQQIRFAAHWLKTMFEAFQYKQLQPTPKQRRTVRSAIQLLCISILILERLQFFSPKRIRNMTQLNPQTKRIAIDLLADAAHARHTLIMLNTQPQFYMLPKP
ncbi:MAG: hypothetical protein AAGJ35_15080, partial [Myxococcota bacterium]